jgi:hypothetical protein
MNRRSTLDSFVTLKYELAGVPISESHNLQYNRDEKKEQELFEAVVSDPSLPFALVHDRSDFTSVADIDTDLTIVPFVPVGDFTILHWRKVIERATEIHCIDSSLLNFVDRIPSDADLYYHPYTRQQMPSIFTIIRKPWKEVSHVNS